MTKDPAQAIYDRIYELSPTSSAAEIQHLADAMAALYYGPQGMSGRHDNIGSLLGKNSPS